MGFASKLEDETERRGGEARQAIVRRLAYVFDAYGVPGTEPERQPAFMFDEEAQRKLDIILERLERIHHQKNCELSAHNLNVLKTQKFLSSEIDNLIIFLKPYIARMSGQNRRRWDRNVELMKKFRFLFR